MFGDATIRENHSGSFSVEYARNVVRQIARVAIEKAYARSPDDVVAKLLMLRKMAARNPKLPDNYREHLQSDEWKERRNACIERYKGLCCACHCDPAVMDIHHRTYERFGEEEPDDYMPLCRQCHTYVHPHGEMPFRWLATEHRAVYRALSEVLPRAIEYARKELLLGNSDEEHAEE